ncbi:MAG: hypothetical protein JWP10_973 [Nocardioidaceae bacterium]|nr:hypothetical protein [Nocardioidaceae bacterium]
MAPIPTIPAGLTDRAFTTREARAHGVTRDALKGSAFVRLHRGVYVLQSTPVTLALEVEAARLILPSDAALSHTTNLQWHGIAAGRSRPLHFSSNTELRTQRPGIVLHRRIGTLSPKMVAGVPALGPDRTFVDAATQLSLVDLVRVGDQLIRLGLTNLPTLLTYTNTSHLDGVIRARRAAAFVRDRVDSVKETDVRLLLVFGRLPEPETNINILDARGRFIARGDLVYRSFKVVVEYDGWQHERDAFQRQRDHLRREALEAAGWLVIVITIEDFARPQEIVWRAYRALFSRGYRGPKPVVSDVLARWMRNR